MGVSDPRELGDEMLRSLMYAQIRQDIVSGKYFVPPDAATQVAALHVQHEFGDRRGGFPSGFLADRISEYLPVVYARSRTCAEWEGRVLAAHRRLAGTTPADAERALLDLARAQPWFGKTIFDARYISRGAARIGQRVFLGVSAEGFHIFTYPTMAPNGFYPYGSISTWGVDAQGFAFTVADVSGAEGVRHMFAVGECPDLSRLVHGYIRRVLRALQAVP